MKETVGSHGNSSTGMILQVIWTEGMRRLPRPWEPGSGEICAQPGGKMNGWVPCPKLEVWFRSFFLAKMGDL